MHPFLSSKWLQPNSALWVLSKPISVILCRVQSCSSCLSVGHWVQMCVLITAVDAEGIIRSLWVCPVHKMEQYIYYCTSDHWFTFWGQFQSSPWRFAYPKPGPHDKLLPAMLVRGMKEEVWSLTDWSLPAEASIVDAVIIAKLFHCGIACFAHQQYFYYTSTKPSFVGIAVIILGAHWQHCVPVKCS